ncbi:hypothetical protein HPB51_020888 [Rhipicephalus microplus]|uniref:PiggyBac transposable element-derived protein domain-containing protein n=1 Tax=Rhipicephalus microplus TaxID=6941 RepID=A0A9J6EU99_RHIMP|nr:hypothetical protein HPB51_020888 [Rhipicephalus microplus]
MFAQLDNGNLSSVGDTEDDKDDDERIFREAGSDDCMLEMLEASDESDEEQACKAFEKPSTDFTDISDEIYPFVGELPNPYEYFSHYISKSTFAELADKTNMYHKFEEGKSVHANEERIRKFVSLHLLMGVVKYPRLRLYWKPILKTKVLARMDMSSNRFEQHHDYLLIVDVTKENDSTPLIEITIASPVYATKLPLHVLRSFQEPVTKSTQRNLGTTTSEGEFKVRKTIKEAKEPRSTKRVDDDHSNFSVLSDSRKIVPAYIAIFVDNHSVGALVDTSTDYP